MKDLDTKINQHITNLQAVKQRLRNDIPQIQDDKAKALYETTAEVLEGLINAFADYQQGKEAAWRGSQKKS